MAFLGAAVSLGLAMAQRPVQPDWRRVGNAAIDLALPGVATGAVNRVWYSADGARLWAATGTGAIYATTDFETWKAETATVPAPEAPPVGGRVPESAALRRASADPARQYAAGRSVWRSDDGGINWTNVTAYKGLSILGSEVLDLAVSPSHPDEIVAANTYGIWRSLDGGTTWAGLNQSLPNLAARRIRTLPAGGQGLRVEVSAAGDANPPLEVEWAPGEKLAWRPSLDLRAAQERAIREQISNTLDANITVVASAGNYLYVGSADGRLWASADQGQNWTLAVQAGAGRVEAIWAEAGEPRIAIAALGAGAGAHIVRTTSGGSYWTDLTSNLPASAVYGLAADRGTGALYAATSQGLFYTYADLRSDGAATQWAAAGANLPAGAVRDVRLDAARNQVYASVEGWGVFVAIAPHRIRDPRIVGAADMSERAAAPGALLSVLGSRVLSARADTLNVPILDAADSASQIQVPFEAAGTRLRLALTSATGNWNLGVALQPVSPAIFVDPEGTPFVMDAETGVMLSGMNPARSSRRVQILASGLGRVRPDWPTGMAAPLENPPQVAASVRVTLNGLPLTVTRATLAPGYVGFYLIEAEMPALVNSGPAELVLEAGGVASNRVRLQVEP